MMSVPAVPDVAIIGGGPAGLFTSSILETTCGDVCNTTIFEASDRVGGKVVTCSFRSVPILYEAGVAEFYDYSQFWLRPASGTH